MTTSPARTKRSISVSCGRSTSLPDNRSTRVLSAASPARPLTSRTRVREGCWWRPAAMSASLTEGVMTHSPVKPVANSTTAAPRLPAQAQCAPAGTHQHSEDEEL